jgi:hypothetical protein
MRFRHLIHYPFQHISEAHKLTVPVKNVLTLVYMPHFFMAAGLGFGYL